MSDLRLDLVTDSISEVESWISDRAGLKGAVKLSKDNKPGPRIDRMNGHATVEFGDNTSIRCFLLGDDQAIYVGDTGFTVVFDIANSLIAAFRMKILSTIQAK
eukprot:jgi/Bigna1/84395/fgenesh1_pg.133_\